MYIIYSIRKRTVLFNSQLEVCNLEGYGTYSRENSHQRFDSFNQCNEFVYSFFSENRDVWKKVLTFFKINKKFL